MLVKEIMNRNVIASDSSISLREAARIMMDNRVGSIIIKKNEDVIGILTENDILTALARNESFEELTAGDVMTRYVIYISPEARIEKAANILTDNKIKKLPVLDNDKLVGIVTASDIAEAAPEIIKNYKDLLKRQ